jgi:hypothetical protein
MKQKLSRSITELLPRRAHEPDDERTFDALHWMVAGVFLAAGAEAAFGSRRGAGRDDVRIAPLVAGTTAAAAHVARALLPHRAARTIAQLLNGVAIGVGAAGVVSSVLNVAQDDAREWRWSGPRRKPLFKRIPSLAPLTFGVAGGLGVLLDREERADAREHDRLERRARIVERLVPKRRARVDRIVIHV